MDLISLILYMNREALADFLGTTRPSLSRELMKLQQKIAFENSEKRVGKRYMAMIEGKLPQEGVYLSRTYMDAPNIDGYLFVESMEHYESGEFVKVKVTGAKGYDLTGVNTEKKKLV